MAILRKNTKTGKRSHFAVTKGGETTYKEFLGSIKTLGTKFCSKFVVTTDLTSSLKEA